MIVAIATGVFTLVGFLLKSVIDGGSRRARARRTIEADVRLLKELAETQEGRAELESTIADGLRRYEKNVTETAASREVREPTWREMAALLPDVLLLAASGFALSWVAGQLPGADKPEPTFTWEKAAASTGFALACVVALQLIRIAWKAWPLYRWVFLRPAELPKLSKTFRFRRSAKPPQD